MSIRFNWIRVACVVALAFGIASMPLVASAQTKAKHSKKGHKVSHTKKTHSRRVHHVGPRAERPGSFAAREPNVAPAPAERVSPPMQATPTGPVAGRPYDEATWRGFHSDWNGQYFYNGGKYYYDQEFKYPAQIPNDFNSVAARFGGVATLENDPTLVFTGDSGEPYPLSDYNIDRYKSDKKLKLKSAYFGRAYFWREGVRYDRKIIVNDKGERCFQFVKHA